MKAEPHGSFYDINGELYPRVTHVLQVFKKPGLDIWRNRVGDIEADRVSSAGALIGTQFHNVVKDINLGKHKKNGWRPPEHLVDMSYAYIEWLHSNIVEIISAEELVVSHEHKFAGTTDLVARHRDAKRPAIWDVKTSNDVSEDWPLQLSAYKMANLEMGRDIDDRYIIHVPKKGKARVVLYKFEDHEEDEAQFLHALAAWRWLQDAKKRVRASKVA